ncbi:hypothetical protein DL95DRAFT_249173, partial [Leptodontidium sp. 2 PMI_412]
LQTRAWVLQERMLSRRILHFCHHELVWECDTHVTCECSPQRSGPRHRNIRQTFFEDTSQLDRAEWWAETVALYSRMSLTIEHDRPNAISALAMIASKQWGMTYISGLWKEQLPGCLLWYMTIPG